MKGPWLIEQQSDTSRQVLCFHRPHDALIYHARGDMRLLTRLTPQKRGSDQHCYCGKSVFQNMTKWLIQPARNFKDLSRLIIPQPYWYKQQLIDWLYNPADINLGARENMKNLGPDSAPQASSRTQHEMDISKRIGLENHLFRLTELDFGKTSDTNKDWGKYRLYAEFDGDLHDGTQRVGGRGRLGLIEHTEPALGSCPAGLVRVLRGVRYLRLIFLTPGLFSQGNFPADRTIHVGKNTDMPIKLEIQAFVPNQNSRYPVGI